MDRAHGFRLLMAFCLLASPVFAEEERYRDVRVPIENRVADLLDRMTLEEQVGQMCQKDVSALEVEDDRVTPASLVDVFEKQSCGTMTCLPGHTPEEIAARLKAAQDYLRTETRLGIPAIPVAECLHGVQSRGATVFPQAIPMGSTWDPELMQEVGAAIAEEASAIGVAQCLSPVFDLARDPRFGRVEECYGECPTLVSRMPLECDARIRSTWFWNTKNADTLKTVDQLTEIYYHSVGHGAVLLLNQTPDTTGRIPDADVKRGAEFAA